MKTPAVVPLRPLKPLKSTAPADSILNPARAYVPSNNTDIAETFKRIRAQQQSTQKGKE